MQATLEKLKHNPEPEAGFMLVRQQALPAYNIQTAVDTEHALIVTHAVVLDASDIRCLQPMAAAAKRALGVDSFQIVADAGYSKWGTSRSLRSGGHDPACSRHAHS